MEQQKPLNDSLASAAPNVLAGPAIALGDGPSLPPRVEHGYARAIVDYQPPHGADSSAEAASQFEAILSSAGPMGALRFLNGRTRFRFTGVYHAEPPLLRNVHLYDRENPTLNVSGDVCPIDEAYCAIVWRQDRPFDTPNATKDQRLGAHAARERVLSYCGVPIRQANGFVWGTLCHFDVRPRLLPPSEIPVLEAAASMLAQWAEPSAGAP